MNDQRKSGIGESTLTIKWWAVILVFLGLFGFLFTGYTSNERRITTLETHYTYIRASLQELKTGIEQINKDKMADERGTRDGKRQ